MLPSVSVQLLVWPQLLLSVEQRGPVSREKNVNKMCSVIEIKNANEYYIHYHSPESLNPNEVNGLKKMEAVAIKEASFSAKDAEVTSDRGSSASPSLEDEEEQAKNEPQITAKEQQRPPRPPEQNGSSPSKIPVRKKLAPQPPVKKKAPQPPNNPFIEDSPKSSRLPRPKGTAASNAKLTPARSLESVPITVNSHIPASPLRPVSNKKVSSSKAVTSEMGTQVDNNHKKSVSVENLSSAKAKHPHSGLRKTSSESADQILDQGKKWSYTNGRPWNYICIDFLISTVSVINVRMEIGTKIDSFSYIISQLDLL